MCEKIKKTITVYVNGNRCNLRCSYCYYTNAHKHEQGKQIQLEYPMEQMISAFSPDRVGGICEIVVVGSAETLLEESVIPFVHGLLRMGHVVTVVTNATLSNRIEQLLDTDKEDIKNLIVKASLHWEELKKRNLVDKYFNNIKKVIEAGGSSFPFLTIAGEYVPYLEEIAATSRKYLGAVPHCSPCVEVVNIKSIMYHSKFRPECTDDMNEKINALFDSRIYNEIVKNREMNPQEHFCYAGVWSFGVDFVTGAVSKCHGIVLEGTNFYENVEVPFALSNPVACSCGIESCCLQYNFFAEGLIPDYDSGIMYGDMIYKEGLVTDYIRNKLNVRFDQMYSRLSKDEEIESIISNKNKQIEALYAENNSNPFWQEEIYEKVGEGKEIAIYGTGNNYERYKKTIGFPVSFFLDSYISDERLVDGKRVYRPENVSIKKLQEIFIVISVKEKRDIQEKLEQMGLVKGENYI